MSIQSLNALNLSVSNAEKFVESVKDNSRILSFFLGGDSVETDSNLNTDQRRSTVFKDASIIRRVQPSGVNVVVQNVPWVRGQVYNKWNSKNPPSSRYYVSYNNNVYLILDNSDFNTKRKNGTIPVSTPPIHTSGVVKQSDGYAYLYLYTITATDKAIVNSSEFMSVPDKIITGHSGKLMTVEIDLSELSSSNFILTGTPNPIVSIQSDSGTDAKIQFETVVVSSPHVTTSQRKYKIVGVKAQNYGTTPYTDFELRESLKDDLNISSAQSLDISNAMTIGFSPITGIKVREVLGAKFVSVNLEVDSSSITTEVEQREFFNFGIFEDIEKPDGTKLFSGDDTGESFSNQLKLTVVALGTASTGGANLTLGTDLTLASSAGLNQKQISKFVGKKQVNAIQQDLEVHTTVKTFAEVGGKVKVPKSDEEYTIVGVTQPNIKQNSGKSLHIGSTRFDLNDVGSANKRFFAQVIQRF